MGTLYIVATPIGNREDITFRALRILKEVSVIACEDTRHSKKLLSLYDITTPLISYHQHSGTAREDKIGDVLFDGKDVALITDAGTPTISDPGGKLVSRLVERFGDELSVIAVPGPSAIIAALSVSGFIADAFVFYGFLPHKKGRKTALETIVSEERTIVLYESSHRILKLLTSLESLCDSGRKVVVCREITKQFESVYRGTTATILEKVSGAPIKGEYVVIIEGDR